MRHLPSPLVTVVLSACWLAIGCSGDPAAPEQAATSSSSSVEAVTDVGAVQTAAADTSPANVETPDGTESPTDGQGPEVTEGGGDAPSADVETVPYFDLDEEDAAEHDFQVGGTVGVYGGIQIRDDYSVGFDSGFRRRAEPDSPRNGD